MIELINKIEDPSINLALEECFFLSEYLREEPVFCIWRNTESVIIGVSQDAEQEVNLDFCTEHGIPVVRRKTGGGAVYHDPGNLNFTFFYPHIPAGNAYRIIHDTLRPAFDSLGIKTEISPTNDILCYGRKFSGMATRERDGRLMVHGTILYDTNLHTMAQALTTDRSKFIQPKGVKSRHAKVINLRECSGAPTDIHILAQFLRDRLRGQDAGIDLRSNKGFLTMVRQRAQKYYTPLNLNDIKSFDRHI